MATKSTLTKTLDDLAIATDLLLSAKNGVRTYTITLTEKATPEVRKVLKKQLDEIVELREKIAQYMIDNEMYHAHDIEEQVNHDLKKVDKALDLAKG
ncbi:spore coat protein [Priestia megaterium]|uniref:Spore coat protein n=1 Tax=Priestia megaterium TaxID=1404 RepID=A0A3D8WT97_PRIMG|nr:spore coat protein [Priestia megaterium]MDH3174673.1 spore coat protein [Priestia megaterium]RDZ04625.1 spore coat protein [Priestia megaterium]